MADEYAQNLPDIPERTATADSDLIHVNSGGSDYKQTKLNFLRGDFFIVLSNSASITSSAESLEALGTYFGSISSYGHQSETGVPENTNFYFKIQRMGNANYISIELWNVNNVEGGHYIKSKVGGTWGDWVKVPSRSEISALNNSLTQCLTTYQFAVNGGTHTLYGLNVGDIVIFVRNALGMYSITFLTRADAIITPVGLENVSMSNGNMTFTRTSQYSGEIVVLSRSRNLTIS